MIRIKVNVPNLRRALLQRVTETTGEAGREDLNLALGERMEDELLDYFDQRNLEPNRRGWRKQGWWGTVADATQLTRTDAEGAEVTIAHSEGFAIRVTGGTITPRTASALTIPLVEEAYGRRVSEFEEQTNQEVFRPRGTNILAVKKGEDEFEAIYALVKKVTIQADPRALPETEDLEAALAEETEEWVSRNLN